MTEEASIIREAFVCVRLGLAERYGITYTCLEHITKFDFISRIPCTPPVIAGVVNYRGVLLTVLDLKQLFRTETGEQSTGNMVVVVRFNNLRVGLLVDEVEGSDKFIVAELEPPMHTGGVSNLNYVQGIHQGRVTILNIQAILTDPQLQVEENVV
jgi:purine-binding chemotaxis protein CheW